MDGPFFYCPLPLNNIMTKNQTVFFTTSFDPSERSGIIQEVTSVGYLINNIWYSKKDIKIRNVLLDSKTPSNNQQLILG